MDHSVRDLDTCWETVEDQPANFGFENSDEIGKVSQILFRTVNGCGQVPLERTGDLQNLIAIGVPHQQRRRPEDFRVEIGAYKRIGIRLEHCGMRTEACCTGRFPFRQDPY